MAKSNSPDDNSTDSTTIKKKLYGRLRAFLRATCAYLYLHTYTVFPGVETSGRGFLVAYLSRTNG
jgi:hypothetical protein